MACSPPPAWGGARGWASRMRHRTSMSTGGGMAMATTMTERARDDDVAPRIHRRRRTPRPPPRPPPPSDVATSKPPPRAIRRNISPRGTRLADTTRPPTGRTQNGAPQSSADARDDALNPKLPVLGSVPIMLPLSWTFRPPGDQAGPGPKPSNLFQEDDQRETTKNLETDSKKGPRG